MDDEEGSVEDAISTTDDILSIKLWCLRHIFTHAMELFMVLKKDFHKKNEDVPFHSKLATSTRAVLMVSPGLNSAWNMRWAPFHLGLWMRVAHA